MGLQYITVNKTSSLKNYPFGSHKVFCLWYFPIVRQGPLSLINDNIVLILLNRNAQTHFWRYRATCFKWIVLTEFRLFLLIFWQAWLLKIQVGKKKIWGLEKLAWKWENIDGKYRWVYPKLDCLIVAFSRSSNFYCLLSLPSITPVSDSGRPRMVCLKSPAVSRSCFPSISSLSPPQH